MNVVAIGTQSDRQRAANSLRELADNVETGDASAFWVMAYPQGEDEKVQVGYELITTSKINQGVLYMAATKYMQKLLDCELNWDE